MQVIEKQIFLRRSAKLSQELRINGSIVDADWLGLSDDADALVQRVWDADWHFFHLTEEVKGSAPAMSKEGAADAAFSQALTRVQASQNTAEVVSVRYRSLFGMHFLPGPSRRSAHPIRSDFAFGAFGRSPLSGLHAGEGFRISGVFGESGGVRFHIFHRSNRRICRVKYSL